MTPSPTEPSPPLQRKPLQAFVLHATFISLLLWVLPSLDAAYAYGFTSAGNSVFGSIGSELRVVYRWVPPQERDQTGEIEMEGYVIGQERAVWDSRYSVRDRGYQPTAVLIALILATPASRRRHILGGLLGATALNSFYLAQTGLLAASLFAAVSADLVPFGKALAGAVPVFERLFGTPIVRWAAVFAVWAVAAAPSRGLDVSDATKRLRTLIRPPARD